METRFDSTYITHEEKNGVGTPNKYEYFKRIVINDQTSFATHIRMHKMISALRWEDKAAWIDAHLFLIRMFWLKKTPLIQNEIFRYFNEYGNAFLYEVLRDSRFKGDFFKFKHFKELVEQWNELFVEKQRLSVSDPVLSFLEWVGYHVENEYLPPYLEEFEKKLEELITILVMANFTPKNNEQRAKLFHGTRAFLDETIKGFYAQKPKRKKIRETNGSFYFMWLGRICQLREEIALFLYESPRLIEHINYLTHQLNIFFKDELGANVYFNTPYVLYEWEQLGDLNLYEEFDYIPSSKKSEQRSLCNRAEAHNKGKTELMERFNLSKTTFYTLKTEVQHTVLHA